MFSSLFKHAQASVEQTIGQALLRAAAVVPFLIAAGFATAALTLRLQREFGGEAALAIMAGGYVVVGLVMWAYVAVRTRPRSSVSGASTASDAETASSSTAGTPQQPEMSAELMLSALTATAPLVLPAVLRLVLRNLPILAAIAAAIFVLTRPGAASGEADASEPVADSPPPANDGEMPPQSSYAMAAE